MFNLSGKCAIVTGGGQGLGKAMAFALAQEGADVVIVDINLDNARDVANKINERIGRNSLAIKANVIKKEDISIMLKKTINKFKKIDILVNNAGISDPVPAEEMPEEKWQNVIEVNMKGTFLCTQVVVREMIKSRKGKIINIASIAGINVPKGFNNSSNYCTSKAGIIMMTRVWAVEWAKYNINVNCISPGFMKTPLMEKAMKNQEIYQTMISNTPLRRMGNPEDLSGAVVFLASEDSNYITGQNIIVDGGYTLW